MPGNLVTETNTSNDWARLTKSPKIKTILIGPGLKTTAQGRKKVLIALNSEKTVVLDAGGLSAFQAIPSELTTNTNENHVLTPHEGEFNHVFKGKGSNFERVRFAAQKSRAIVVLKGSSTIIANSQGTAVINDTGTPYLATAGSGDVLAGIISGLMSQGMSPFHSSCAGTWIHGRASEEFGPGLIAEDIPDLIPNVLANLL